MSSSLEKYKEALSILSQTVGEIKITIAQLYQKIASILVKKNVNEEAITFFKKSILIKTDIFGEIHSEVAEGYLELGNLFQSLAKESEAKYSWQKSYEIKSRIVEKDVKYFVDSSNPRKRAQSLLSQI